MSKRTIIQKLFRVLKFIVVTFIFLYVVISIYVYYKKEHILSKISIELSERLQGNVEIRNMDISMLRRFPSMSVVMNSVSVSDSMYSHHKRKIFEAKEVLLKLNWAGLISGTGQLRKITVSDGRIHLYTDSSGYTNKYLTKNKSKQPHTPEVLNLPSVDLFNMFVIIEDLKKQKYHEYFIRELITDNDAGPDKNTIEAELDILAKSMIFKRAKGSYLKGVNLRGKISLALDINRRLSFEKEKLYFDDDPLILSGFFDLKKTVPLFSLKVEAEKITYARARALLPERTSASLAVADIDKPIKAVAIINGILRNGGPPLVNLQWKVSDAHLITPLQKFDNASFNGTFTNEVVKGVPRTDSNSRIMLTDFSAQWNSIPVTSEKIELLNLKDPLINCDLSSTFSLEKLNRVAGIRSFEFNKGNCAIKLNYKGPLLNVNNNTSVVNGTISFNNGEMIYTPRNITLQNIDGDIIIRNSDVFLEKVKIRVMDQWVNMNATARNLLSMAETDPSTAVIDFNIFSPSIDLARFKYLLQSRRQVKKPDGNISTVLSKIDDILERGRLNVLFSSSKLSYNKFNASDVSADLSMLSDRYIVHDMKMKHAGGKMQVNGSLVSRSSNHDASLSFKMNNMQVTTLFNAFENFGQDAVTSANLEGNLTVDATADLKLTESGTVIPSSIKSDIKFLLRNGELRNFEPVKKMQKFVFKNRNFDTIQFADLKNTLHIRNQEIQINRMEVRSSVLVMYVEGIYSNLGKTDLSIQLPLSNLRRNRKDEPLENMGNQKRGGTSIFLRGKPGKDGNIDFKLALFKSIRKKIIPNSGE